MPTDDADFIRRVAVHCRKGEIRLLEDLTARGGSSTWLVVSAVRDEVPFVIKVGPAAGLQRELEALDTARRHFENVCTVECTLVEGQRMGVVLSLAGGSGAATFSRFFKKASKEDLVGVLETLFRDTLRRASRDRIRPGRSVFELYRERMERLTPQLGRVCANSCNLGDWWCAMAAQRYDRKTIEIFSHGDLNGGNILVARGQPFLIDFSRAGNQHVMSDVAKLERELRLKLLLRRTAEPVKRSTEFESWFARPGRDVPPDPDFAKVGAGVECIRSFAEQSLTQDPSDDWELEYNAALLFQYACAAVDSQLSDEMRRVAVGLADRCRLAIEKRVGGPPEGWQVEAARRRSQWRLAYAWLRMDQLPSGGWGKTLPQWMENIWAGGSFARGPEMRTIGGTDFSCTAFYNYAQFLLGFPDVGKRLALVRGNGVARFLLRNLSARMGDGSGSPVPAALVPPINEGHEGRLPPPRVNIRHSAMAMVSTLVFGELNGYAAIAHPELSLTATYLCQHLSRWREDRSHLFAMFAALGKLLELLECEVGEKQLASETRRRLVECIRAVLPAMQEELTRPASYVPLPANSHQPSIDSDPFFVPYGRFWRMERCGFLMYLPLLLSRDADHFLPHVQGPVKMRLRHCLLQLLSEIGDHQSEPELAHPLPKYHRRFAGADAPSDWGMVAELAKLLQKPPVRELLIHSDPGLIEHDSLSERRQEKIRVLLGQWMLRAFDGYHEQPNLFKFTQSVSFSAVLDLIRPAMIDFADICDLDGAVSAVLADGITEQSLHEFTFRHIFRLLEKPDKDSKIGRSVASVRDLLLEKLQSGEYTPDERVCLAQNWEPRVKQAVNRGTIDYYEGEGSVAYVKRYGGSPFEEYVTTLKRFFPREPARQMHALDLACGPGQYAELLQQVGFTVDLYDASAKMLAIAAGRLGVPVPRPRNYYSLAQECPDQHYDLIFACAMMVHVPKADAPAIYKQFYRILKPGGVAFVSYKIGDHSLIATDGRFFEYYPVSAVPVGKLEEAGFEVRETIERWNRTTSNSFPKNIRWANVFAVKPASPAVDHHHE